jgi:hypothetical protein
MNPWIKPAAILILALALVGLGYRIGSGLTEARWQRAQVKAEQAHTASIAAARESELAAYDKSNEVSREYQEDLAKIRAERDRLRHQPVRVVRVYIPADPVSLSAAGAAAGGSGSTAPAAVELAGEARSGVRFSRDVGPELYGIVDDSDQREAELAEQIRKLQAWAK